MKYTTTSQKYLLRNIIIIVAVGRSLHDDQASPVVFQNDSFYNL